MTSPVIGKALTGNWVRVAVTMIGWVLSAVSPRSDVCCCAAAGAPNIAKGATAKGVNVQKMSFIGLLTLFRDSFERGN